MAKKSDKLIIIDGNALLHRAFHALPPLTTKDGKLVNAVYGFTSILLKIIKDYEPAYIAATFDRREKTFRHKEYKEYKATRIKQPDELYAQIDDIKRVLESLDIPIYEKAGFEADDVIGTIAHKMHHHPDVKVLILTGDLDTLQLVDDQVEILTMKKGINDLIVYNEAAVYERYGLKPEQMVYYKALRGDPSDNIPGVKGIGEKTAVELIKEFKDLEGVYKNLKSKKIRERVREMLESQKEQAEMSLSLSKIHLDVPIEFKLDDAKVRQFNQDKVVKLFQELEFKNLLAKFYQLGSSVKSQASLFGPEQDKKTEDKRQKMDYTFVSTEKELKKFITKISKVKEFAVDTETTSLNSFIAKLLGISFCWKDGEAYYVSYEMVESERDFFAKLLANHNIHKIGHNIKYDLEVLQAHGFEVNGIIADTMIMAYLLNPGERNYSLDTLAFVEFGYTMQPITDLIGAKGKNQITLDQVDPQKVSWYSCEDADYTWRLFNKLTPEIKEKKLESLMHKIETPLIPVLADMERVGVKIDLDVLQKMSKKVENRLKILEEKIYKLAGKEFNISSPLQLREILFKDLKIDTEGIKSSKTGLSTSADELEKLEHAHPIIPLIMEFRELKKLQTTYIDALPELIEPATGRIHTSFNQAITSTGRLSSSEPNLQNIPIRTELGKEVRNAFIAEKGFKIVAIDYSQIELRIVASISKDKNMMEVFERGEDIHRRTAAYIHQVDPSKVTSEMRRSAKEVNFGVLYGMGAYGLAMRTGISRERAQKFIATYFKVYPGMKKYIEATLDFARKEGYVETYFGRRRYLPEIVSTVPQVRNSAERMAINMPIQGTAADLMKLAMIEVHKELPKISPDSKMILQVHDELVFEIPDDEVDKVSKKIKKMMEEVCELKVPITAEVDVGDNWGSAK